MQLGIIKKLRPFLAPHKITFQDPDTGKRFIGKTRVELIQKIVTYRAQNELPEIENLKLVLENYWCNLPENKALCDSCTLERGWMKYLKGGIALIKTMLFDNFVEQSVADDRAAICLSCPKNIFPEDKSQFQEWSDHIAEQSVGDRRSVYHETLGNCSVCSCVLKAKVWYSGSIELSSEEIKEMPSFCWQPPLVKK